MEWATQRTRGSGCDGGHGFKTWEGKPRSHCGLQRPFSHQRRDAAALAPTTRSGSRTGPAGEAWRASGAGLLGPIDAVAITVAVAIGFVPSDETAATGIAVTALPRRPTTGARSGVAVASAGVGAVEDATATKVVEAAGARACDGAGPVPAYVPVVAAAAAVAAAAIAAEASAYRRAEVGA